MGWLSRQGARYGRVLREGLQAIRRHRGLTAEQAAKAMHMSLRSYQRFENGENRLNIEHLLRFAEATDSDPAALITAALIERPELARRCADNKLALLALFAIEDLNQRLGDDLGRLEPRQIVAAMSSALEALIKESQNQRRALDDLRSKHVSDD